MAHTYEHPRPALTVDVVLVSEERPPRVLLIQRRRPPFAGAWALPGGFVDEHEPLERAARRELREETGVEVGPLALLGAYGDPGRDPRGWTVSVAWLGRVASPESTAARAADDAAALAWYAAAGLPALAFDHDRIVADALARLGLEGAPP